MTDIKQTLQAVIDQTLSTDLNPIKNFLFTTQEKLDGVKDAMLRSNASAFETS